MDKMLYDTYVTILKKELIPAFGCTEPIAIAYAAAIARETLEAIPDHLEIITSGNIIKNVKSVIVPGTNGLKGIEAAAAAGVIAGNSDKKLEVINNITPKQREEIKQFLSQNIISAQFASSDLVFDLTIIAYNKANYSKVQLTHSHTNLVLIEKNGTVLFKKEQEQMEHINPCESIVPYDLKNSYNHKDFYNYKDSYSHKGSDSKNSYGSKDSYNIKDSYASMKQYLTVENIVNFAQQVNIDDVKDILDRQIKYNMAIAEEGLLHNYGANIGQVLLKTYGNEIHIRAKAKAAAGSDARMNGCELPVVINSGSGNQGITVSVPIIEYAKELNIDQDRLYRALIISNLVAIHQKSGIGSLSAYCGAVSAGSACSAGLAYLLGGSLYEIEHTIVNTLAITSGIICDGAKASCAAKIATAVDAGLLGYYMITKNQQFKNGDGIIKKGVEQTISCVGRLGREGMKETDKEILQIMLE